MENFEQEKTEQSPAHNDSFKHTLKEIGIALFVFISPLFLIFGVGVLLIIILFILHLVGVI